MASKTGSWKDADLYVDASQLDRQTRALFTKVLGQLVDLQERVDTAEKRVDALQAALALRQIDNKLTDYSITRVQAQADQVQAALAEMGGAA